jgi:hypothetical protein
MRSKSRDEINEVKEKFEEVKADDIRVQRLGKRVDKMMSENNFAPTIIKALGVQK